MMEARDKKPREELRTSERKDGKDLDGESDWRGKRGTGTFIYLAQDFTFHNIADESHQDQPRNTPSASIANYQVTKTS
jgi:hypothetical protein